MDGLLILSQTRSRSLILRSSFSATAPSAYPLAITDALIHLLNSTTTPLPPILYLPSLSPHAFKPFNSFSSAHLDSLQDESTSSSSSGSTEHSPAPHPVSSPIEHHAPFSSHQAWANTPPVMPSESTHSKSSQADKNQLTRSQPQHRGQLGSICCNLFKHNLWLVCVASSDMEPSIMFEFMNRFIDLVSSKCAEKPVGPRMIEANFELVHMLLSLTAPTRESPFGKNWSETGLVDEIVPNPTRSLVKLISQAAETLSKGKKVLDSKPSIFSSNIPWRPTGIEYAKQEILLDFTEKVSAILDRDGKPIKLSILGIVDVQSRLSGMPDLSMIFTDPSQIMEAGFHGCVRSGRWATKRVVSFVPPDGRFKLMSYRAPLFGPPPVVVQPTVTHGTRGGSFAIVVVANKPLVQVAIRWHLGQAATGIVAEQLGCRRRDGRQADVRWEWDELKKSVCWTLKGDDVDCCLTGLWTHSNQRKPPSHAIGIEFEGKAGSPSLSGLKVEKLEIFGDDYGIGGGGQELGVGGGGGFGVGKGIGIGKGTNGGVRKGVKMKFESSKYEVRW